MADKTVTVETVNGKKKKIDLGIYGELSKAGVDTLNKMMAVTSPTVNKKKKAVKKTAK